MLRSAILALICASLCCAEESAAVKTFTAAMAGDDNTAKRDAIRGLVGNKVNVFVDGVRYSNGAQRGGVNTFLDLIDAGLA